MHRQTRTLSMAGVLVAAFATLAACANKGQAERCQDLSDYLDGRRAQLDRTCETSDDCSVIYLRRDSPTATSHPPVDAQLQRAIDNYERHCGPTADIVGTPQAVCVERTVTELDRDAESNVTVSLGMRCMLRGQWSVPEEDAGADVRDDADTSCECPRCGSDERCHACVCVPRGECGDACIAADQCGALPSLGLGSDAAICSQLCEAALDRGTQYERFVRCLRDSPCSRIESCASVVP